MKIFKPTATAVLICLLTFGGWAGLAEAAADEAELPATESSGPKTSCSDNRISHRLRNELKSAHTDQRSDMADEAPPLLTSTNAASVNPRPLLPPIALPSAHDTVAAMRRSFIAPLPTNSWSALEIAEAFWQHVQDMRGRAGLQ